MYRHKNATRVGTDLQGLVLDSDDSCLLIPEGLHSEPLLQVIAGTGTIPWPSLREAGLAGIDQIYG